MRVKLGLLIVLIVGAFGFISCNDDDDNYSPDQQIVSAFYEMYPDAKRVEWERKIGYFVADFKDNGKERDSWFDAAGKWVLTETEIPVNDIPAVIKEAINNTEYNGWHIDDADYLERIDMEPVYVIEVEKGDTEVDRTFSETGELLKVSSGNNNNPSVPTPVDQRIKEVVNAKYPGAKILDIDFETNTIEVDVLKDNVYFEVILDKEYNWLRTEYELRWADVPEIIKASLERDDYTFNTREDEVDKLVRPATDGKESTVYRIELDREPNDLILYYDEEGNALEK